MYFLQYFFNRCPFELSLRANSESYRTISEIDATPPIELLNVQIKLPAFENSMISSFPACILYMFNILLLTNGWNLRISCHYPGNSLYFLSISFQKRFPGIFPARAQYFLLPGNFLASGSFVYIFTFIVIRSEFARRYSTTDLYYTWTEQISGTECSR